MQKGGIDMDEKDIVWSREIRNFAAYLFGYTWISEKAADWIYGLHEGYDSITETKRYKDIIKLFEEMTVYYGHDYVKDFLNALENYGVEVTT